MKILSNLIFTCTLLTSLVFLTSFNSFNGSEYDIKEIYKRVDMDKDYKALTTDGIKEAIAILKPFKFEKGKHIVKITRQGENIYRIEDSDIYIETKYCTRYPNKEEAILNIESNYSYNIGKIKF